MKVKFYQEKVSVDRSLRIPFGQRLNQGRNRLILLDVEIWSPDKSKSKIVPMALDTGAQVSEIDSSFLQSLGYTKENDAAKPSRVHNGQGWLKGFVLPIRQIRVAELVLVDFRVNVTPFDRDLEFRGLLGLNFVESLASISVDWKNGVVELRP